MITLYPQLHIRVMPGLSPALFEQIEGGTLDAAVMSEPRHIHNGLNWLPFYEEELVLLASPEVVEDDPFLILEKMPYLRHTRQSAVGMMAEEWLAKNNIRVHDLMEMGSLENLPSMVAQGLGVAIGPNIYVPDPSFEQLRKISLGPSALRRTLGILTRSDCSKLKLLEPLLAQIKLTIADSEGQTKL